MVLLDTLVQRLILPQTLPRSPVRAQHIEQESLRFARQSSRRVPKALELLLLHSGVPGVHTQALRSPLVVSAEQHEDGYR